MRIATIGKTWRMGAAIAAGSDESKVVELGDGTVVQNMRSRGTGWWRGRAMAG